MKSARMAFVLFEIQFTVKCFVCKAFLLRILDIMPVEWIFHIIFQRFIISVHVWERNQTDPYFIKEFFHFIKFIQLPAAFVGPAVFSCHFQKKFRQKSLSSINSSHTEDHLCPGANFQHLDHSFVMTVSNHAKLAKAAVASCYFP